MAPSTKRRRRLDSSASFLRLIRQLEEWVKSDTVLQLDNEWDAADQVRRALDVVSYDESLNGWWKWYKKTLAAGTDPLRRQELLKELVKEAKTASELPEQPQLARLLPPVCHASLSDPHKLMPLLAQLRPHKNHKGTKKQASQLARQLWPHVEHDYGQDAPFDYVWIEEPSGRQWRSPDDELGKGEAGLCKLIWNLWNLARKQNKRAISLSVRVREDSALHELCQALDQHHHMSETICPPDKWCPGPPEQQAGVESEADEATRNARLPYERDRRYYLLLGTPGALTKSHWDRGVQAVLYHTIAGTNHALAVPRRVALALQATEQALEKLMGDCNNDDDDDIANELASSGDELQLEVLKTACGDQVRAGTFGAGETMLILPGGGHAVLTGKDGKVVLAGEWHLRTDIG